MIAEPEKVSTIVKHLKDQGVSLAIDDFGTGYSSLGNLKRFAVDRLKIDQSFVRDDPGDADDEKIVYATINLAKSLNIPCAVEGVETRQQANFMQQAGCHEAQGFLYAKTTAGSTDE